VERVKFERTADFATIEKALVSYMQGKPTKAAFISVDGQYVTLQSSPHTLHDAETYQVDLSLTTLVLRWVKGTTRQPAIVIPL
jgi:hypothetical protein